MAMNFIVPLALGALQGIQNKQKGQSTGQALLGGALGGLGMRLPSRAAEVASAIPQQSVLAQPAMLPNSNALLMQHLMGGGGFG